MAKSVEGVLSTCHRYSDHQKFRNIVLFEPSEIVAAYSMPLGVFQKFINLFVLLGSNVIEFDYFFDGSH